MLAARQYSYPSLMVSGVSPFHQPGEGRAVSTVSMCGCTGVIGSDPFVPVSSQPPAAQLGEAHRARTEQAAIAAADSRRCDIIRSSQDTRRALFPACFHISTNFPIVNIY